MSHREATPIRYDLITADTAAARKFGADVMGWTFEAMPDGKRPDRRIASADEEAVAGIMQMPDHAQGITLHVDLNRVSQTRPRRAPACARSLGGMG